MTDFAYTRKSISTTKLINHYLSNAAQYLNRTKSFHINENSSKILHEHPSYLSPARSVPSNIHVLHPLLSPDEMPIENKKKIKEWKSNGLVQTLRRSLRKNKDRFANKRSVTMKSCQSLNQYPTPILTIRHHYHHRTDSNERSEKIDQLPPLQPLTINGRDQRTRFLSNVSPQSLLTEQNEDEVKIDQDEKEKLKNDLIQLKNELEKSKETIARLQKSEEQMRERLAEQAQRQLEKGGKFEDLNQIARPTELIRAYNTLYTQSRIDALDALDNLREMSDAEDLKSKLLFSVVVLAFRHAQNQAKEIRNKIRQILQLTNDKTSVILEETIEKYLRTTIQKYDVTKLTYEVENQLWTTLYDYPSLKTCNELLRYITNACRTAWGLVNQTPAYFIEFQSMKFDRLLHERFHTSDNESETIIEYVWPSLIDGRDRTCVARGVVLTDERYLSMKKKIPS